MSKKLIKMLKMITRDLKDAEFYSEEILDNINYDEPDLVDISEELAALESSESLDEDELDILKSLLVYILLKKSSFEKEEIYSLVFGGGKRVVWN
ncbi:MAG: hypothetical protein M0Z67_09335 [Nitrospiraceae bacterium]|nr:hypothetical protein [Nitrospiraceae bacterium]MDA8240555.1 hypothetical protein [Nitrospiraceae bacterium]